MILMKLVENKKAQGTKECHLPEAAASIIH